MAAATGVAVLGAEGVLIEPNRPRVVRKEIVLRRWPSRMNGFSIALLSDFHYDPLFSVRPLKAAVDIVNGLHPDLIVFAGDYVSVPWFGKDARGAAAAEPCAEWLRKMQARNGLWAVLGNHDAFTDPGQVTDALRSHGIQVLENQSAAIESNGGRFWLAGVNDVVAGRHDLPATLQAVPSDEAVVLLAHEPDYADHVQRYAVDLQLSGHSHGGQVRLPFIPPLLLPPLAKKYVWGLYQVGGLTLYTNPGLGTVDIPARLNCPPEITLLTVRQG